MVQINTHDDIDDMTESEVQLLRSLSQIERGINTAKCSLMELVGTAVCVGVIAAETTYDKEREALGRIAERMGDKGLNDVKAIIEDQMYALDTQQTYTRIMEGALGAIGLTIILTMIVFSRKVKQAINQARETVYGTKKETEEATTAPKSMIKLPDGTENPDTTEPPDKTKSANKTGGASVTDIRSARKKRTDSPSDAE